MIVGDSPLLRRRLLFVTAHVVSGLLANIGISKDGLGRVESLWSILILNIFIYERGLLFDRHLVLYRKAVLLTLDYSLEALDL
jgi:hypothetical protein